MATRYWKATTSGSSIITAANWTGSGVLTTDDLIIDLSNSAAALAAGVTGSVSGTIVSGVLTCNSLTVIDTVSKPLNITGTSTMSIGGGSNPQFITTVNTVWNHTGVITCLATTGSVFSLNTNGAIIQAPITLGNASNTGTYKTTGLFKTSKTVTLSYGTLDISTNDLYCGIFSSSANTRSIAFGTSGKGIYLDNTATATLFTITSGTGFSYTGTSRIVVTNSGSLVTKTINTTGLTTRTLAMNFYFSDANKTNNNTIVVTGGSYFLDFDATNWTSASSWVNSARTIYGNLNLCANTTWTGTTATLITTFNNTTSTSAQVINYNSASGVGPITIAANNVTYPVNIADFINSIGNVVFSGSGIINLTGIGINALAFTHSGPTLNTNTGSISATTYTLNSGNINFATRNFSYGTLSCTGAFTLSGGTLNFPDIANQYIVCFTFAYTSGTLVGLGNGNNRLPQQIEVNGRSGTYAVSITGTPTVTGNIGFLVSYDSASTSSVTIIDSTGAFSYTFNTSPLIVANCVFKNIDLTDHSTRVVLATGGSFIVNGSFYGGSCTYNTTATGSTNSTGTVNLNGGTQVAPSVFNFTAISALNFVITGFYQAESEYITGGSASTIVVNSGAGLNFANSEITVNTLTLNNTAIFKHNNVTIITIVGVGTAVGVNVLDASLATFLSTDNSSGTIILQAPGTVTTNIRNVRFPASKVVHCISIAFDITNPKDIVKMFGTCGLLDASSFEGTLDISSLKCASYNTITAPYTLSANILNVFTDETTNLSFGVSGDIVLSTGNLSGLSVYVYGSSEARFFNTNSTAFSVYIRNSVTASFLFADYLNFQILDIGDSSTFTANSGSNVVISTSGTYKCSSAATLTETYNVKFLNGGSFYTGGKTYGVLENANSGSAIIQVYDSNATINTYTARGTLVVNGNNLTITDITGPSSYTSDITIVLRDNITFSFSTITYLSSSYKFYLNTDSSTVAQVTVKFNKPLLIGLNSSPYPTNSNITKVASGYSVTNFVNLGTYQSGTSSYDPAKISYVYTGVSGRGGNFFLMF